MPTAPAGSGINVSERAGRHEVWKIQARAPVS